MSSIEIRVVGIDVGCGQCARHQAAVRPRNLVLPLMHGTTRQSPLAAGVPRCRPSGTDNTRLSQ
jgi:hypothetical protein